MPDLSAIFKAYDIRGKVGTELTPELARAVGRAFADWLPSDGTVAVGRDMRPDSAELAAAFVSGVIEQGRNVLDIGQITTDMIYFAVGSRDLAGGAVITASHNPGEYNGIKLCAQAARPIGIETGLAEIRDAALSGAFKPAPEAPGVVSNDDLTESWISYALSYIDSAKLTPLRLAVDAGNGMAGKIFPEIEPYVPWEITEMYFELDGTFPNHEANPLKFETLTDIITRIKADKLDGGIAFDGDGDRAFLIDETGTVLTGSVMCAMLSEYFLGLNPGASITYDVRVSRAVPELIARLGGTTVRTRVGHSFIKQAMRDHDAPFGGEASGHFYFRDNWYADSGLLAAVIGIYVATLSGKTLSQLREHYSPYANIPETNFTATDKDRIFSELTEQFKDAQHDTLDGLTITQPDGSWFNVRASNTEPVIRLNAEAPTHEQLAQLVERVTAIITRS